MEQRWGRDQENEGTSGSQLQGRCLWVVGMQLPFQGLPKDFEKVICWAAQVVGLSKPSDEEKSDGLGIFGLTRSALIG